MIQSYRVYSQDHGYEPFIDFLKGLAIMGVVWLHCMPLQNKTLAPLWCGMSVSLFLLVQVFHAYRKGPAEAKFPKNRKLFCRILLPMLVFTAMLGLIHLRWGIVRYAGDISKTLIDGGYGPGSYYPWIYIQFAFILPILGRIYKWIPRYWGRGILMLSILLELLCATFGINEELWRIIAVRYIFLIWLGYDVVANGIKLTPTRVLLAFVGIFFILCMYYLNPDLSPLFIHNGWKVEHWPAYFYPAYLLLWLIRSGYDHIPLILKQKVTVIGRSSYEIFLCQMFYFALVDPARISFVMAPYNTIFFLVLAWSFSIGVGIMVHKIHNIGFVSA